MNTHYILTVRCKDAVGIVAAVASALSAAEAFITESSHFGDEQTGLCLQTACTASAPTCQMQPRWPRRLKAHARA